MTTRTRTRLLLATSLVAATCLAGGCAESRRSVAMAPLTGLAPSVDGPSPVLVTAFGLEADGRVPSGLALEDGAAWGP